MLTIEKDSRIGYDGPRTWRWFFPRDKLSQGLHQFDKTVLYLVVPLLGVGIPNTVQIITNSLYAPSVLFLHYTYFVSVSFLVWKGNVFWLYNIRNKFITGQWNYTGTVLFYFLVNVVYSGLLSFLMLYGWTFLSHEPSISMRSLLMSSLIVIVAVVFVNNVYELFYLHAERAASDNKAKASDTARIRAELQTLKGQFDPHFLYNSLHVLSCLIVQQPKEAEAYNAQLGKLMQYPLKQKCNDWVLLGDELEFTQAFFQLQEIRFGDCMRLFVHFSEEDLVHSRMVPPMALQLLVENAMKHNRFSENEPLAIHITIDRKQVKVWNAKHPKPHGSLPCSGTGLVNLQRRVRLLCGRSIDIKNGSQQFSVTLPLLPAA